MNALVPRIFLNISSGIFKSALALAAFLYLPASLASVSLLAPYHLFPGLGDNITTKRSKQRLVAMTTVRTCDGVLVIGAGGAFEGDPTETDDSGKY